MTSGITYIDWAVIIGYFALVFFIAFFVTIRENKKSKGIDSTAEGYFLAGRNTAWWVIGASLFASNIGSEHIIGLTGQGASGDFPAIQFELLASLILLLLGWVFVPFYIKSGVFTMPEFLEKRYNKDARSYLSVISIFSYVVTKISFTIFAGALVFETLLGIEFWTGAIIVVVATGLYTVFGGMRAVMYTDMIQMWIFVLGGFLTLYFGIEAIGGIDQIIPALSEKTDHPHSYFNLWRGIDDEKYPWTGIMFGAPILGIWYWCTDQFIVQRVLSAKNIDEARKGSIYGGFLKLLPLFIFMIPGVLAFALVNHGIPGFPIDEKGETIYDSALPLMIKYILPVGVRGLIVAGFLAALMSSLSSIFNSCSTLITWDFFLPSFPNASQQTLVNVGRISTVVLVIIGLAWIPLMKILTSGGGVYTYLQSVQAYISPPIAAVFILGIFNKRITSKGAMYALLTGFFIGMSRLVLEVLKGKEVITSGILYDIASINFLHFAIIIFLVCVIVLIVVSYSDNTPQKDIEGLVYEKQKEKKPLQKNPTFWYSVILVVLVLVTWIVFSPLVLG